LNKPTKEIQQMKKTMFALMAVLSLALAACKPANAADYTYVGAGYTVTDVRDASFDGYNADLSVELGDVLFVRAGYANGDDADLKLGTAKLGLGFHDELTDSTDIYGVATAIVAVDDRADFDKYTYEVEAGLRSQVTKRFELRGGVIATDVTRSPVYMGTAGVEFALTEAIRLSADVRGKEDVLGGQLGVRFYF